MTDKRIALDLAAFQDSPGARALEMRREDVRSVVEIFLTACYEGLGKAPHLIDGEDMHALLGHLMPGRFGVGDPLAAHVPRVIAAYLDHLETVRTVTQAFEIRRGLDATADEFLEAVRTGRDAGQAQPKQDPFVHGAPKTGRNDPCFCGSGKKFKKCHGKESP